MLQYLMKDCNITIEEMAGDVYILVDHRHGTESNNATVVLCQILQSLESPELKTIGLLEENALDSGNDNSKYLAHII